MEPININVQIQVGVTQQLYDLLASLASLPTGARIAQAPEVKPEPVKEPEVTNRAEQPQQPEAKPAVQAPAMPVSHGEYTEVDVRAAMDEARKRIEGEDY